jgi:hypothetical protein
MQNYNVTACLSSAALLMPSKACSGSIHARTCPLLQKRIMQSFVPANEKNLTLYTKGSTTVAALSKAWTVFAHSRHERLSAFILFVFSYVGSGLASGWSPIQGVLPTKIKELKWNEVFLECLMLQVGGTGRGWVDVPQQAGSLVSQVRIIMEQTSVKSVFTAAIYISV